MARYININVMYRSVVTLNTNSSFSFIEHTWPKKSGFEVGGNGDRIFPFVRAQPIFDSFDD